MSKNNIVVIGSGAREHALCWKLSQSPSVSSIIAIPGNAGTARCPKVTNQNIKLNDFEYFSNWLKANLIHIVVVGPEVHLAAGISNALTKNNIMCFGPSCEAAVIESDKEWAKTFMDRNHIPTAQWKSFRDTNEAKNFIKNAPFKALVIKAAGLAGGKGVIVANDCNEACDAVDSIKRYAHHASDVIIVEELLEGEEVSILAFTDGETVEVMLPVQDHKRLLNDDKGPNTGGMGAFCPFPLDEKDMQFIKENIMQHTVSCMARESNKFVGVLYAGLMITQNGIKVLEFNCRFGDPETQVLMPLLDCDLYKIIEDCCTHRLALNKTIKWKQNKSCVGVVVASKTYPYSSEEDELTAGLSSFQSSDELHVFHGNTFIKENKIIVRGGRAFNVVAIDDNLIKASARATRACENVELIGSQYRTDIGWKGIVRTILRHGKTTYKLAGVDITAADCLIKTTLKADIESTFNKDVISSIGGFGALYDGQFTEYKHPILVSSCDGVGTKLKIAQQWRDHSTIGQDLVAMCVNDILAQGAKPLFFLDYFACGKLKEHIIAGVVSSIAKGCRIAKCALVGGETAEMPGFYKDDEYDLAGFVVGVVDKTAVLPKNVKVGDKLIYLPSNGIHSNGYSLVRKIFKEYSYLDLSAVAPFSSEQKTFGEELLRPTKIYTDEILPLIENNLIKAFAHITGGGLLENIGRVLPDDCRVDLDALKWNIPSVFGWLAVMGNVNETEMLRTFNCGVGGVLIVSPENVDKVIKRLQTNVIGEVHKKLPIEPQVLVRNFEEALSKVAKPLYPIIVSPQNATYKRVAVLISGTGTNLKALIESTLNDPFSPAKIVYVISNSETAAGIKIAEHYRIPVKVIRIEAAGAKTNDMPIIETLEPENVDIICLAGYMRMLSSEFVHRYKGRIINIHPSLLPAFKGLHAQKQALDAGSRFTGCTVHFVEDKLDSGAIIDQRLVTIQPDDNVRSLTERIKEQEHKLFPHVLKLIASGKVVYDMETKRPKWQ